MMLRSLSLILFLLALTSQVYAQKSTGEIFTSQYLDRLIKEDNNWFHKHLTRYPNYFSQRKGKDVRGKSKVLQSYISDSKWLKSHGVDSADIQLDSFIYTREKMIQQASIMSGDSLKSIPLAVVTDVWDEEIDFVRMYYNAKLLDSITLPQNPIFAYNASLKVVLPPAVKSYLHYLERADTSKIHNIFHEDCEIQTFDGSLIPHASLTAYLDSLMVPGGIVLHPTRLTFDGDYCALEWNLRNWGKQKHNGIPGLSIFEIKDNLIIGIREYATFELPFDIQVFKEKEIAMVTNMEEPATEQKLSTKEIIIFAGAALLIFVLIFLFKSGKKDSPF